METGVRIGSDFPKGVFFEIADAITAILRAADETRMDQATTLAALQILPQITKVENVIVRDSVFNSHPKPGDEQLKLF